MSSARSTNGTAAAAQLTPLADVAAHASSTTAPLAEAAHTTLSNALTTPTAKDLHTEKPAAATRVSNIVIRDPAELARKRARMIAGGAKNLQVIADFDRTISAFKTRSGEMCAASHQLVEMAVGAEKAAAFLPAIDAINTKYFALEISHDITDEQRKAHMQDWWHQAHSLLVAQGIRFSAIEAAVRKSREDGTLELRKGAKEFLHTLSNHGIPCLIFSAGVRETISQTLVQEQLMLPNIHLIGNRMYFGEDGVLKAFDEDSITSSNKNYTHVHVHEPEFHAQNLQRRNVIVTGDNPNDASMVEGMEDIDTCIKIGLLHDNVEGRLAKFSEVFDVVLLDDADFSWMQQLLDEILAGAKEASETQ